MTCIAGFVEDGIVWLGADSAGVGGYDLSVRADQKLFRNGPMLFGFTDSFRMGQILRYTFQVPDHVARLSDEAYMSSVFVDAVRACLKGAGWAAKHEERESGGTFLVGYRAALYCVQSDYQVQIAADGFDAIGCGGQVARGALFATWGVVTPRERLEIALRAAERCSAGVRGPFLIETLPGGPTT